MRKTAKIMTLVQFSILILLVASMSTCAKKTIRIEGSQTINEKLGMALKQAFEKEHSDVSIGLPDFAEAALA